MKLSFPKKHIANALKKKEDKIVVLCISSLCIFLDPDAFYLIFIRNRRSKLRRTAAI